MSKHLDKTVRHFKAKQSAQQAKDSANRFTQKQSQFSRRQEEQQVRGEREHGAATSALVNPLGTGQQALSSSSATTISRFEAARREQTVSRAPASGSRLMNANGPRWADKYRLDEGGRPQHEPQTSASAGGLSALLGSSTVTAGDEGPDASEPARKKSRHEKFQDVISTSRQHRFEAQKERSNRDKEAAQLDAEFDTLQHLLEKRDRLQEDREAFEKAGSAEVRKLLDSYRSTGRTAKVVKLSGDGSTLVSTEPQAVIAQTESSQKKKKAPEEPKKQDSAFLDESDLKLLAKVRQGAPAPPPPKPSAKTVVEESADEDDDFDALMGVMRLETRKAHAVERTLTEEEEIARLERARQLEVERSRVPLVNTDSQQLTRKEWLAHGGDSAFVMNDDDDDDQSDNVDIDYDEEDEVGDSVGDDEEYDVDEHPSDDDEGGEEAVSVQTHGTEVEKALQELERFASSESLFVAPESEQGQSRSAAFQQLLVRLHDSCRRHPVSAAQTYRLLLLECQRRLVAGQRLTTFLKLVLFSLLHIYPMSDYRHGVVTPFLLYLCSALTQHGFQSLFDCATAVQLASMLTEALAAGGGRYSAEPIVSALNIIALQAPKRVLEPAAHQAMRMPCPLNRRHETALLGAGEVAISDLEPSQMKPLSLLLSEEYVNKQAEELKVQILFNSYKLLAAIATTHASSPAFTTAIADPVERLFALIDAHVHPALRRTHTAALETIRLMTKSCEDQRTPLAMRHFRPRPIRLFDPLLLESIDPEVKERRELKREIREDRKRVVRQVQAEAVVERRARERESAAEDARRTEKYHQLMSELQSQQHIMKTVDMSMAKARSKKKKSISGAPNTGEGAAEE